MKESKRGTDNFISNCQRPAAASVLIQMTKRIIRALEVFQITGKPILFAKAGVVMSARAAANGWTIIVRRKIRKQKNQSEEG
jgi:tRNA A37 N6-isopentenylltransferase MiaA